MSELWLLVQGLWVELLGLIAIGFLTILIYKVKKYFANKVTEESAFISGVKKSTEIIEVLAALRAKLGATRASVFLFHNGSCFINGDSILKVSCTHQSVAPGVSNSCHMISGILISSIPEAVEYLVKYDKKNPKISIFDASKMVSSLYKSVLDSQGVQTELAIPIHNKNQIVGVVVLHFLDDSGSAIVKDKVKSTDFLESVSILEMLLDQQVNKPKKFFLSFLLKK